MSKELEDFSSLFKLTPSVSILHCTKLQNEITKYLENIVISCDGKVSVIENNPPVKQLQRLAKQSSYDYVILDKTILEYDDKNSFMKVISRSLRDAGYIIILEEKNKSLNIIYSLLEEFDYGAVNSIDIFKKHNLIMGKKLHMWGMD